MTKVVILGAGLTGLSAAYHFEKKKFFDFKIFEKESTHGGLARSVQQDGFTFDFTGHLLHSNDSYFYSVLNALLPEQDRNAITRNSFVFMHDTFVPYPIQMNLAGLPQQVITECFCGFAKRKHHIKNPQTFKEWVLKHFGSGFGKHFFFPYNQKLWCTPPEKLHPSWTGRFIPQTTIHDIVDGIQSGHRKQVGYNHHFYYPKRGGIQTFADRLRRQIASPIYTNHKLISVDIARKQLFFENGHTEKYEQLITTIPLDRLLHIIHEPSNLNLRKNRHRLLCNSVINFNVGFANPNNEKKHWTYIPEKKYPFYRVGFWHNFSDQRNDSACSMCPTNCGSFYGEMAYRNRSGRDALEKSGNREEIVHNATLQTCKILGISPSQIITEKTLHIPHAYVVYDAWRDKNLYKIHKTLQQYKINSVGRYGEWKYASMQEAILDGKAIADEIMPQEHMPETHMPGTQMPGTHVPLKHAQKT